MYKPLRPETGVRAGTGLAITHCRDASSDTIMRFFRRQSQKFASARNAEAQVPFILPVLAGKDGLEFRDTQQVRVRGDYEVGMFGQSGGQVETVIVRKNVFL